MLSEVNYVQYTCSEVIQVQHMCSDIIWFRWMLKVILESEGIARLSTNFKIIPETELWKTSLIGFEPSPILTFRSLVQRPTTEPAIVAAGPPKNFANLCELHVNVIQILQLTLTPTL